MNIAIIGSGFFGASCAIQLAKKIKGEIVNADSMQVYKNLKILTARPLKKDYQNIKHHLYGFQNGKKNLNWLIHQNTQVELKQLKCIPLFQASYQKKKM